LVYKFRIIDLLEADLVSLAEDSSEFCLGLIDTTRQYQCRIPQINEGHFAAALDSPSMPQFGREAGLASMRNFCLNHLASHACIVSGGYLQGAGVRIQLLYRLLRHLCPICSFADQSLCPWLGVTRTQQAVMALADHSVLEQRYVPVREVLDSAPPGPDVAARHGVDGRTLHRWLPSPADGVGLQRRADVLATSV
jgi:hypothetical protein